MAKKWRCAVVGTNTVGTTHVRVLPQLANATLVAVCDSTPAKSKAALDKAAKQIDTDIAQTQ